ncbi:uncharacterized protein LOC126260234 [Schistocerca nitens]|uniref:uncharacterized protein LOC126260234 n=1 Tax=Schistocerca nitens TaxID=7011 RepID=UPI002117CBAD|nr:uncharacterized protein LOC126260234 [Schistocerca nitens]
MVKSKNTGTKAKAVLVAKPGAHGRPIRKAGVAAAAASAVPKRSTTGSVFKPDFTLDKAAAERLMRNIQKAKRRRCVCHAATSFLGLAVFLLSVMLVSLAMTGGRRYFGSL